jgi:HAD superfamily hydrolase (TIGR01490 family)
MQKKPTKLAIFDIDGTIFRSSLLIELINALVKEKILPIDAQKETEKEYLAWLDRKGSYENYINKVVKIYGKYIAGRSFVKVNKIAQKVIRFQKDRVYRFTRDLIEKLKKQNFLLVAVSGSPFYIVERYAKAIGFNLCFGTEIEIKSGKFTGKVLNLDSAYKKAKIIKDLLKRYPRLNLRKSLAVGDTESDADMLKLVGYPVAFNPNAQLTKIAKRHHWQIVVERKDTIYQLEGFKLLS